MSKPMTLMKPGTTLGKHSLGSNAWLVQLDTSFDLACPRSRDGCGIYVVLRTTDQVVSGHEPGDGARAW